METNGTLAAEYLSSFRVVHPAIPSLAQAMRVNLKITACRPGDEMPHAGDIYWPDGCPGREPVSSDHIANYIDTSGKPFKVCFTEAQILNQFGKQGVYTPYIPLIVADFSGS